MKNFLVIPSQYLSWPPQLFMNLFHCISLLCDCTWGCCLCKKFQTYYLNWIDLDKNRWSKTIRKKKCHLYSLLCCQHSGTGTTSPSLIISLREVHPRSRIGSNTFQKLKGFSYKACNFWAIPPALSAVSTFPLLLNEREKLRRLTDALLTLIRLLM